MSLPFHATPRPARRLVPAASAALAALAGLTGCAALTPNPMPRYERARPAVTLIAADSASRDGGDVVQAVTLRAADGTEVELLVKRPADAGPERRAPVVLILGGHQRGRDAAHLVPETHGHVIAALSYPYRGADRRLSPIALLRQAPAIRRAAFATPTAIQLALDWLLAQPWADPARVEGVGASLGAPFMTVAAAHDPRITRLWLLHAGGLHWRLLQHNTRGLIRFAPLRTAANGAVYTYMAGRHFSPDVWVGRVSPRPVVMINAVDDERLPRDAVQALHDSARSPKRQIWLPGKHVQGNRPEVVRALVSTVLTTMREPTPAPEAPAAETSGTFDASGARDASGEAYAGGRPP